MEVKVTSVKIVLQDGIKDCGICCLLSVIRYYGGEISKEYLREITHTTKEGVTLYDLMEGAKEVGFEAVGVSGKIEEINVNNLPCIAHFIVNKSYKHFVVLYSINQEKQQVTLMDPAKGKKVISFAEFHLLTSSNYLFLKPIKKLPVMKKKNIIYKNIIVIVKNHKKLILFIILLTTSYFIFNIITSFHFKFLLEYSIQYHITDNIYRISYILLFLYLFKNINLTLRNILLNKWISLFDEKTTFLTFKQLLLLPYLYFKNRTSGEVISRFRDLNTIRSFVSNFFCVCTTDLVTLIIFLVIMLKYQFSLTIKVLVPFIIIVIFNIISYHKKKYYLMKISNGQDRVNADLIQGISNVDTIKGSHLEKRMIDKFSIHYQVFLDYVYRFHLWEEGYQFLKSNLGDVVYIMIYGIGSFYVIKDKMALSTLLVYQVFFRYFINSFYQILSIVEEYGSYKIALERVEELFMISKDNFVNNYFYLSYQLKGNIIFHNLSYKVGSRYLFNELDWSIKEGDKVLLSGESGSGKSSLLKILLRYIEVPFGVVSIAGIDINHYHLENIRSNITYVTSNEYLFTDSLKNNITLYKEYSEEEFREVCEVCLVDDIIKNSMMGYETLIEENGFNFSNGERQRIILARSIIRKSSIYIFDESFSGIDINREKKILENIFKYLEDKTVIVISHRFNNKKLFDHVCRLDKGKIHES